jgi:hypothetical protein
MMKQMLNIIWDEDSTTIHKERQKMGHPSILNVLENKYKQAFGRPNKT